MCLCTWAAYMLAPKGLERPPPPPPCCVPRSSMLPLAKMCSPMPIFAKCFCHRRHEPATHRHWWPPYWSSTKVSQMLLAEKKMRAPPRCHMNAAAWICNETWFGGVATCKTADGRALVVPVDDEEGDVFLLEELELQPGL